MINVKNISSKENDTIINTNIDHHYNPQCRKINFLKNDSILNMFSKIPMSLIKYAIILNLVYQNNSKQRMNYEKTIIPIYWFLNNI